LISGEAADLCAAARWVFCQHRLTASASECPGSNLAALFFRAIERQLHPLDIEIILLLGNNLFLQPQNKVSEHQ
jgi:hypothetical protein